MHWIEVKNGVLNVVHMQLLLRVVLIREESAKNGVFHFHFINKVIEVGYLLMLLALVNGLI